MAARLLALRAGRPLPPREIPDVHFCQRLGQPQDYSVAGRNRSIEKFNDFIGNRTHVLPACSIRSLPTTSPRAPINYAASIKQFFLVTIGRVNFFFPLWLYSPILGLDCLHETIRFLSVCWSRTVGRTPWTGDQLVARPLLTAPVECDDDG
jgi:hypothetical protein